MKKTITLLAALAITTGVYAQENKNKNVKETTTTTKSAVVDDDGIKVSEKVVKKEVTQKLGLTDFEGTHNFQTVMLPKEIDTEVTYNYEDEVFAFEKTPNGYKMVSIDTDESRKDYADIVKSSQQGFFYVRPANATNSVGYYDENGNFIIETYHNDQDLVTVTRYSLSDGTKLKNNKK